MVLLIYMCRLALKYAPFPQSFYWKHHPDVYGGYEGCVGEKGLVPCAESQGYDGESLYSKYPTIWNHTLQDCQATGYTTETRTFWILWGDPLDKTGMYIFLFRAMRCVHVVFF